MRKREGEASQLPTLACECYVRVHRTEFVSKVLQILGLLEKRFEVIADAVRCATEHIFVLWRHELCSASLTPRIKRLVLVDGSSVCHLKNSQNPSRSPKKAAQSSLYSRSQSFQCCYPSQSITPYAASSARFALRNAKTWPDGTKKTANLFFEITPQDSWHTTTRCRLWTDSTKWLQRFLCKELRTAGKYTFRVHLRMICVLQKM